MVMPLNRHHALSTSSSDSEVWEFRMSRSIVSLLVAGVALLFLIGCSGDPAPTTAPTPATLSLDEYLVECSLFTDQDELEDDATYGDLSVALGDVVETLSSLAPPAEVADWHNRNLELGRALKGLIDSQPEDQVIGLELLAIGAGLEDLEEAVTEAENALPAETRRRMAEAGCLEGSATEPVPAENDHGDDFENAAAIAVGEAVRGTLDSGDDKDVFVFRAEAGQSYEVALSDYAFSSFSLGSKPEPEPLIAVYDSAGRELARIEDDSARKHLAWQAVTTENHYVVLGDGVSAGDYTLTVGLQLQAPGPEVVSTAAPGSANTPAVTPTPVPANTPGPAPTAGVRVPRGVAAYVEECETAVASLSDVFEVDAEGEDVTWGMLAEMFDAFADAFGQLSPPQELQAYHGATLNTIEAIRDHARTRPSEDSYLEEFVPIMLEVFGASLEVTLDQTKTEEEKERAIEDFLAAKFGSLFGPDYVTAARAQVEARRGLSEEMLALLDSSGCGELFAAAPGDDQPIAPDVADDHGDDIGSATAAAVGSYFEAALDHGGDVDYFSFQAEEGERYQIDIELRTLEDSELTLYNAGGWELAYNDDYGDSLASRIAWTAPESGEFYVEVGAYDATGGTYALTIALSDVSDDHGDDIGSATAMTVGDAVESALDYDGDVDYFSFRAEEGERYQIAVDLLTLGDSELTLYDTGGRELAYNDDYGDTFASRIIWEAPGSGEYYVEVGAYGGAAGTYTLTIGLSGTQAGSGGRASTQGLTQLTDNFDLEWFPAWSPDGSKIAFSSDQDGDADLYVMNADGSGVTPAHRQLR